MSDRRTAKHVSDMEIDEISLVDRPANQHALVTIAKRRAPKEDAVPDTDVYYDKDGTELDLSTLNFGDHVFDADGQEFVLEENEAEPEDKKEKELASAGVSKAFNSDDTDDLSKSILDELAKAATETERNSIIAKALSLNAELSKRLDEAEKLAKSEKEARLTKEYIAKAAEYNVPIAAEDLGPVLYRMAESMSFDDCKVIHKALSAAGEMLFEEAGYKGQAANEDPFEMIERELEEQVSKSEGKLTKAAATEGYFSKNPSAYDDYVASLGH